MYSLAVHHQALWLLSGLESGGINLQSVRHDEGKRITCLKQHTSAVSVLNLAKDERSVLSGSWDKTVLDWDLNTGQVKRSFQGSGSQISALETRPLSSLPIPETVEVQPITNGTFSSDNNDEPRPNGILTNGVIHEPIEENSNAVNGTVDAPGSPTDSLFGGNDADSLFGDTNDDNNNNTNTDAAPATGTYGTAADDDDDDDFARAIANGMQQQENEDAQNGDDNDVPMLDADLFGTQPLPNGTTHTDPSHPDPPPPTTPPPAPSNLANGLSTTTTTNPHADSLPPAPPNPDTDPSSSPPTDESTFLAASIDGSLRIWDRRNPNPVATLPPTKGCPPWCMAACWSPDGNSVFAGRRNGTVDEYSVLAGLGRVERVLRFPTGSGAVSAVRAMPNGRHLVW